MAWASTAWSSRMGRLGALNLPQQAGRESGSGGRAAGAGRSASAARLGGVGLCVGISNGEAWRIELNLQCRREGSLASAATLVTFWTVAVSPASHGGGPARAVLARGARGSRRCGSAARLGCNQPSDADGGSWL